MINFNAIPFEYEPRRKILLKFSAYKNLVEDLILMNETESAFLCGTIKKFRPKKILEVGVAAGGSTAIILQTLEDIGAPYEMHSVDRLVKHWRYNKEDIGFLATAAIKNNIINPDGMHGSHTSHLGKFLPQVIDEIGGDIDFVILDTVHYLPGEILDFLVTLPYLTNDAVVVLHDVALNQYKRQTVWHDAYATGVLFSAVTAEKFLNFQPDDGTGNVMATYPNIAAFQVGKLTHEYIGNVFLLFTLNWHYAPSNAEIKIYREFYRQHYSSETVSIFNEATKMNLYNKLLDSYT